jgi:GT2 family glycosyltransferase/tetratricopeptide (TPR) repeat protein
MPTDLPRCIAFYLPQFHPIPENDEWWGKGFTEWTNLGKAKPSFPGHHQPRVPADLGYYDLRLPETRVAQAALAREYGIDGFCYYHYWFNGRRLLERPFNETLQSGSPDFPFCLCWANENWTRAWDGLDREVLIGQKYNPDDDRAHIQWLAQAFADRRYIRVHGKPLFLVYRVASLPNPAQTATIWREEARRLGVGELFLCAVESRVGGTPSIHPAKVGFDAAVEFQPDGLFMPKPVRRLDEYGGVFDYRAVVERMLEKPATDYLRFPCVTPGWDNSPRRKQNATIIKGSTPELYGRWLATAVERQRGLPVEEQIIFINAWNEWTEGAYLEPDLAWGRGFLEATGRVLKPSLSKPPAFIGAATVGADQGISAKVAEPRTPASTPSGSGTPAATAPRLSVCIPFYNGNKYLVEAIRSVLEQSYRDFELLVVNDCSEQDPAPILARFNDARMKLHRNEIRLGLAGNWNRCVDLARGELICVFHQDDVMRPENLRRKVEMLDRHAGAGLVYSDARVVEADLTVRQDGWFTPTRPAVEGLIPGHEFFAKLIAGDNLVCCPSVMIRRACFDQLGQFDPELPYTTDWEMWLRVALDFDVVYLPEPLLDYRVHESNETHRFKGPKEIAEIYRAKKLALAHAEKRLPNHAVLKAQVFQALSEQALDQIGELSTRLPLKDLRSCLTVASEAYRESLPQPTYADAQEWFVKNIEHCRGALSAEEADDTWSEEEQRQFAVAKQQEAAGRLDQALAALETLAASKPKSYRAWSELGRLQMAVGRLSAAEQSWSVAIPMAPKKWSGAGAALAMRGRVRDRLKRTAEAILDFSCAAHLALCDHRPDAACELDDWMCRLQKSQPIPQRGSISKEQLARFCKASKLLQAVGLLLGRQGIISTHEMQQGSSLWEQLQAGKPLSPPEVQSLKRCEAVVAVLARQQWEAASASVDTAKSLSVRGGWQALAAATRLEQSPAAVVVFMRHALAEADAGTPVVSIIIPTFNRLELTRRCLDSLQQHPSSYTCEIWVVDNGSTDGTVEFLAGQERAGRLRAIVSSTNLGFAVACNRGARAAQGRHVLFLNNDTEVRPGWLDPLVERLEADLRLGAVGSKLLFPDGTIQHAGVAIIEDRQLPDPLAARHIHYRKPQDAREASQPRMYQALTAACLMLRKSAFEQVGGFDEEYWNGYEDVDLCFKLQQAGWNLLYEPRSVVIHFESQSGPERFRSVRPNTERLHSRWLNKVTPDYLVTPDGKISKTAAEKIRDYTELAVPNVSKAQDGAIASIIVLVHNQLAHTERCLASIERHTRLPYELILVDNGSTDDTPDYLRRYAASHADVQVIRNLKNLGFATGNNQGLAVAQGECVVLLNNDTVVTENWLSRMLAALQQHPNVGVVGPRSNRVLGQQQVENPGYTTLDELPAFAADWGACHANQSRVANRVVGFCLLARRLVVDRIGGLDEQFGSGNFEDDDFCIRAHLAGFETRIADDSFVHHVGNATFTGAGIDYAKAMQTNWTLFKSKWAIPPETPPFPGYLTPDVAPPAVALKVPLPDLQLTHQLSADGRCWMDKLVAAAAEAKPITLPPCALVGQLREAQQFFQQKKLPAAWGATRAALKHRPFHPEAYLLLAEIALAAQDSVAARDCAQFARQIAPEFRPAKKFLKGKLHGHLKPEWLVLPDEIGKHKAESRNWLSVCLIVKNEERFLGQCLASVKGLAHQIVVVDTGSADRTVEIAKEHGAQVHSFAWCDDFSAARNAALEHATGDWVLMLDADEELPPEQHAALRKLLHTPSVISWRLPLQDVGREAEGCSYVPRLYRNTPGLYYAGRVHEQVFTSIEERRAEWGLDTRLGDATLRHHGYTKDLTLERDKVGRNLRLLEHAVLETPGDTNLLMNYGLELTRSGRQEEGLRQYRAAFETMAGRPSAQVVPEMREMLLSQFCTQLMAAKRHAEIVQVLTSPLARVGGGLTASLHFTLGLAQTELKEFAAAAEQFRQCLAKRDRPALTPVNVEIRKAGPRHCLALCLEQMGEIGAADEEFRRAIEAEPQARPLRRDYARFLAAHERQADALNLLFALANEKPTDAQVWLQGGQLALTQPEFLEVAVDWSAGAAEHLPDDPAVVQQRAEALMLAGQCGAALPLWRRWPPASNHALAAALVLCETAVGENQFSPEAADEAAVSRQFVKWYQKLLQFNARQTVETLNAKLEVLERTLPSAASILSSALAEAAETVTT